MSDVLWYWLGCASGSAVLLAWILLVGRGQ